MLSAQEGQVHTFDRRFPAVPSQEELAGNRLASTTVVQYRTLGRPSFCVPRLDATFAPDGALPRATGGPWRVSQALPFEGIWGRTCDNP